MADATAGKRKKVLGHAAAIKKPGAARLPPVIVKHRSLTDFAHMGIFYGLTVGPAFCVMVRS
ncbi:MAG: hypothetical protein JO136_02360 [Hyphomicrobiales bacterium]|nr:hypothetical protein [Hyphomicrobiales bacterium]